MPQDKQDFWAQEKEAMFKRLGKNGLDLFEMQDFVESKGLACFDEDIIYNELK